MADADLERARLDLDRETEFEWSADPEGPPSSARRPRWATGMACLAILPLLGYIGVQAPSLWGEFSALRRDQHRVSITAPVGYMAINPSPSYAQRPANWIHDEGDQTLFWSGWKDGKNRWFRAGRGDIEPSRLSLPIGRDVIQAIDTPLYQNEGDYLWGRVPEAAPVVSLEAAGRRSALPVKVMEKVEILNERLGERPICVVYTPFSAIITVYDATVDGGRPVMGHSGYFLGRQPILFDRETESLWTPVDGALKAVSGRHKGVKLTRISTLNHEPWADWRSRNPGGKLLVGADRSKRVTSN